MKSYVYVIFDKINNKNCYVGKHNGLNKNYITSSKILRKYIKIFGIEAFLNRFNKNILEYCNENELNIKEEQWIEILGTFINGLNLTKGGKYDWQRSNYKPVLQYDLNGNFIKEWEYGKKAFLELNLKNYDGISACCKGKQISSEGNIWVYKKGIIKSKIEVNKRKEYKKGVKRIKNQSILINNIIYKSITHAAKDLKISFGCLNYKIKNNKIKYKWIK